MNLPKRSVLKLATLLAVGAALPQLSFAVTSTWTGATNSTWDTTSADWNDGVTNPTVWVNGSGTTTNDAAFVTGTTVTLGATTIAVRNITTAGTTTISGGTLRMDSGVATNGGSGNAGPIIGGGSGNFNISSVLTGSRGVAFNGTLITLTGTATYTGITQISANTLRLGANNVLPTATALAIFGSGRTLEMNGFNQTVASIQGSNGIIQNSVGNATITINGTASQATGIRLTGTLNVAYANTGTLTLSAGQGTLNYTGSTTISAGTLVLSSATTTAVANITSSSAININGGNLTSSGTFATNHALGAGNVTMSAGSISPGTSGTNGSIYSFTIAATKSLITTGGTIRMDLDTTSVLDQIIGSGAGSSFSLTNTTLALGLVTWTTPDYANSYTLFSGFSSGSTSGLTITGYDTTNYIASLSNTGVLSFSAIPEPSTIGLAGLGVVVLAALRRRRQHTRS